VLLSELVHTSAEVGATRSRLAKRAAIARAIRLAAPDEVATVVTYLSGTLRQRRTGIGWASYESVAEAADQPQLTVAEVDAAFERISTLSGAGSRESRREALRGLLSRATETEQEFLWRLTTEELRQGALDGVMQDAVADAFGVPAALVRRAAMLLGSTATAAELAQQGAGSLEQAGLVVGVPVRPMLAASAPDVTAAFGKAAAGGEVLVDRKLDGIRIQVHRDGGEIRLFTRSLDDITRTACPRWSRSWRLCRRNAWCSTARPSCCVRTGAPSRSRSPRRAPRAGPTSPRCGPARR
jgi:DNA ligase-1